MTVDASYRRCPEKLIWLAELEDLVFSDSGAIANNGISLRIDQYFGLCHTGTHVCMELRFDANETSYRYVLAVIHPEAFRDVPAGILKLHLIVLPSYICFSQGRPASASGRSTLCSGGAPPQTIFVDYALLTPCSTHWKYSIL
jgi:hypothetical protein